MSPLVKLVIGLIIGILMAQYVPFSLSFYPTAIGVAAFFLILVLLIEQKYRSNVYRFGLPACIFMVLLGFLRTNQVDELRNEEHFSKRTYGQLCVVVDDTPTVRGKTVRTVLKTLGGKDSTGFSPCMGKIMAYLAIDSSSTQLRYGDVLMIKNRCQSTETIQKIGDFDYRTYLARKQVYHTVYLSRYTWQKVDSNAGNLVRACAARVRERFLSTLSEQGIEGAEYAVASAILLGYSDELTPELRSAYQSSGTMHILCVSGLHVGLFAMVVMNMLFFLRKKRWKLVLKAVLVLAAIWSYALITGFSPSVLRAATMFTFISLGQCIERNSSIYNSLATSAIVLLFYDPMMLFSVGFQLSYLAVIGIVLIQSFISQLWVVEQRFLNYFWELITVSIAAQLATSPLAIYYFHQFPNYFILANMVASPISVLVIPLGFTVLIAAPISAVAASFFGKLLTLVIWILNQSVAIIEQLPASVAKNLDWTKFEMIMAYFALVFSITALKNQHKTYVWPALASLIIMVGHMFIRDVNAVFNVY